MEGQSHQNAFDLTSLGFGGNTNDVSHLADDDLNQHYMMAARSEGIHHIHPPLSQWIHGQQTAHNYVEFLAECGVSEIQREIPYYNSAMTSGFGPVDYSLDIDSQKGRYLRPQSEGAPVNVFTSAEHQICVQDQDEEPNDDYGNVSQPYSKVAVTAKPRNNASRQRATIVDRRRRLRVSQSLDVLQELLPHSKEGGKASLLDDIIEHVKYLQLQLKELTQSRLGSESTSNSFIFLEGYGHYLLHDQILDRPLEEMMGNLLEMNPSAATQLLESRGLFLMPMALAEGLQEATGVQHAVYH